QDAADLIGGVRQHHNHRGLAVGGQPVRLVGPHRALGGDHALARHDRTQRRYDAVTALEHRLIRLWHRDWHGHGLLASSPCAALSYSGKRCSVPGPDAMPQSCRGADRPTGVGRILRRPLTLAARGAIRTGWRSAHGEFRAVGTASKREKREERLMRMWV